MTRKRRGASPGATALMVAGLSAVAVGAVVGTDDAEEDHAT